MKPLVLLSSTNPFCFMVSVTPAADAVAASLSVSVEPDKAVMITPLVRVTPTFVAVAGLLIVMVLPLMVTMEELAGMPVPEMDCPTFNPVMLETLTIVRLAFVTSPVNVAVGMPVPEMDCPIRRPTVLERLVILVLVLVVPVKVKEETRSALIVIR
jgi:hypothetical protein